LNTPKAFNGVGLFFDGLPEKTGPPLQLIIRLGAKSSIDRARRMAATYPMTPVNASKISK
jgi:hypothetical protein